MSVERIGAILHIRSTIGMYQDVHFVMAESTFSIIRTTQTTDKIGKWPEWDLLGDPPYSVFHHMMGVPVVLDSDRLLKGQWQLVHRSTRWGDVLVEEGYIAPPQRVMTPADVPQELINILDRHAGRAHSRDGKVVLTLTEVLNHFCEMLHIDWDTWIGSKESK